MSSSIATRVALVGAYGAVAIGGLLVAFGLYVGIDGFLTGGRWVQALMLFAGVFVFGGVFLGVVGLLLVRWLRSPRS